MIEFDVIQKKNDVSAEYDCIYNGNSFASIVIANNVIYGGSWQFMALGQPRYTVNINLSNKVKNFVRRRANREYVLFDIYDMAKNKIGNICKKMNCTQFLKYGYYEMNWCGNIYTIYSIALGEEGYKFPIYYNGEQIALIEKDIVALNTLDKYKAYVLDQSHIDIVSLIAIYIDVKEYANNLMFCRKPKKQIKVGYSFSKELKSKYDPSFKNRS